MELEISYCVSFGKGDSSERMEYEPLDLDDEESNAAMYEALIGDWDNILSLPELQETYDKLYGEIEESETELQIENEDPYTMECMGANKKDPDDLNDLVHSKDALALKFFNLEDASDDEIKVWDANDLEELPTVAEFDPDFVPMSPYEDGWSLDIYVEGVNIDECEFSDYVRELFDNDDLDTVREIRDNCNIDFDFDVADMILDIAKQEDCQEYIDSCSDDQ